MRRKEEIITDINFIKSYLDYSYHNDPNNIGIEEVSEAVLRVKLDINNVLDNCQNCGGINRGLPGSERKVNLSNGSFKTLCRECEIIHNLNS